MLAKTLRRAPRAIAVDIEAELQRAMATGVGTGAGTGVGTDASTGDQACSRIDAAGGGGGSGGGGAGVRAVAVSGPGFINVWMDEGVLRGHVAAVALQGMASGRHHAGLVHGTHGTHGTHGAHGTHTHGAGRGRGRRVLLDFGSPNVGKELHVGHMRSALIGDCLARIMEWQGCSVDRVSHVGDIGLPVALVVAAVEEQWWQRQGQGGGGGGGNGGDAKEWVVTNTTAHSLGTM